MKQFATTLVQDVLEQRYDDASFVRLAGELVNQLEPQNVPIGVDAARFQDVILDARLLGEAPLADRKTLHVLAVELPRESTVERARTLQRDFVARYLKDHYADASLVAFHTRDEGAWRLSLVTLDINLDLSESGAISTQVVVSPAKRYSFLVGPNEKVRTAEQQLLPLLGNTTRAPTLDEVEDAFSVETVTKQFFREYAEQYESLKNHIYALLEADATLQRSFDDAGIEVASFTKRLLGQIVFLYFLQKKGWLGVREGEPWGTGPTDFLRRLFSGTLLPYDNFFNDVLEPLLYEALALKEGSALYREEGLAMPFLNGGLFEPYEGYAWRETPLPIPNHAFEGVFDVFDRYNFTVREDHPLEKEVAVDPEMLGKVFEQLIEENERHEKGAHYTPREIVHYMTQEALVQYLTDLFDPNQNESVEQNDLFSAPIQAEAEKAPAVRLSEAQARQFIVTDEPRALAENEEDVASVARAVDDALARVKVLDPAIGSGAFPLGLINELVRAREVLSPYSDDPERSTYELKWHAITESIYGSDIDRGAVDIAKLRLWLSLVVDEDPTDLAEVHPLPNLEYKIVQGNSVLSMPNALGRNLDSIQKAKARYTTLTDPDEKEALREEIEDALPDDPIEEFDFREVFSEVFTRGDRGFDIVIGNPPYVRHEEIKHLKPHLKANTNDEFGTYDSYIGTADLFVYFIERGVKCLRRGGTLSYIVSNKWLRSNYGKHLRSFLAKDTRLVDLVDFGELPVFETATTYPMILTVARDRVNEQDFRYVPMSKLDYRALRSDINEDAAQLTSEALQGSDWTLLGNLELSALRGVRENSTTLKAYTGEGAYRGLITGLNEAFVINEATRDRLLAEDPMSHEVIKPFIRGSDIRKYAIDFPGTYLILFPDGWTDANRRPGEGSWETLEKRYPAIARHLKAYEAKAKDRWDQGSYWWELRACAYYDLFEKPKIMFPDLAADNRFTLDESGTYCGNTGYFLPSGDKYLLAILNSPVTMFAMQSTAALYRGGYYRWFGQYVEKLPVPKQPDADLKSRIISKVDELRDALEKALESTDPEVARRHEAFAEARNDEINQLVYKAFDLQPEHVELIERKTS